MNTFNKSLGTLVLLTGCLAFGSVFAQSENADETAVAATSRADARVETDSRAVREGASIITNRTTVEKDAGTAAGVTTPDAGRARVETPNRGIAAEARGNQGARAVVDVVELPRAGAK